MLKCLFSFFALLFFFQPASTAQNGCIEIDWAYNYGGSQQDRVNDLLVLDNGGYLITGYSESSDFDVNGNNGGRDMWVAQLDEEGQLLWENNFGGSNFDEANALAATNDGGFILAGSSLSNNGNISLNNGEEDVWVVKISATGNIQWERSFGGSNFDRAEAIQTTPDGGYIIAGYSNSQNGDVGDNYGNFDCWVFKIDASGNLEWEKNYGGVAPDWAYDIVVSAEGGYLFAGSSFSEDQDVSSNFGFYDFWVVKIDNTGAIEWEKSYGGANEDRAYTLTQAPSGDYFVSGTSQSSNFDVNGNNGASDFWVARINPNGDLLWENNFGGTDTDWAWSLASTSDDGLVIAGQSSTANGSGNVSSNQGAVDFWVVKLASSGAIEWENSFGGSSTEIPYSIKQTEDEGYIIGGFSTSDDKDVVDNYGNQDAWVIKLSPREVVVELGNDTLLCTGQTLRLSATLEEDPAATYAWQDGSTDSIFIVENAGLYTVEVQTGDCIIRDTIEIEYLEVTPLELGNDTSFCAFEPYLLDLSDTPEFDFLWSDGSTESTFSVQGSGVYTVEATQLTCTQYDTISITFNNPSVQLRSDTVLCEGDLLVLNATTPNASYLWSDGSFDNTLLVQDTGSYWVEIQVNGCPARDSVYIDLCEKFRDPCLDIPNAFTPNGDGLNEFFQLYNYCRFDTYQMAIFNRWGEQLFVTDDPDTAWDGQQRGRVCQSGIYVYLIEYSYTLNGQSFSETREGTFALIK